MLAVLPDTDPSHVVAALILYRLIYYVFPLVVAAALLAVHERRQLRKPLAAIRAVGYGDARLAPTFLAALVFVGGVVLLISGSLPAVPVRLRELHAFVPLPFVEASHIAGSLAGTALLLIAPALYRRLDAAFHSAAPCCWPARSSR